VLTFDPPPPTPPALLNNVVPRPLLVSIIYALAFCVFNGKFVARATCWKIGREKRGEGSGVYVRGQAMILTNRKAPVEWKKPREKR